MENFKNVAPIEDFNWDAYENGETVTNEVTKTWKRRMTTR